MSKIISYFNELSEPRTSNAKLYILVSPKRIKIVAIANQN